MVDFTAVPEGAVPDDAVTPCLGGVLLNGTFVPLDLDAIDAEAEVDVAAGRTYSWAEVQRRMDVLLAGWERGTRYG